MNTKRIFIGITSIVVVAAMMFTSCKKKEKEEQDTDTAAASDNSYAERLTNDMSAIGDQAGGSGGLTTYKLGDDNLLLSSVCGTVTVNNSVAEPIPNHSDTVTVDFGTLCQGADGKYRSGKLRFVYSRNYGTAPYAYRDSGIVITVTPINYSVDGNQVSGSKTITNKGRIGGMLTWNIVANVTIVKANNGGTVTWSCNRTKRLLNTSNTSVFANYATPINWGLARIGITGSASGVTAQGKGYTADVTSELVRDFGLCSTAGTNRVHFIQGTIKFKPDDKTLYRYIDFGTGACDNIGTFTIGSWSTQFTMN